MSLNKKFLNKTASAAGGRFNIVLYTGNGSTQSITGVGFQPDLVWIKMRNAAEWHQLMDSTRGVTETLYSNATNAEYADTNGLTSFDSDGFTIGVSTGFNQSGKLLVAWCWKANGGTTASNGLGSITSTVQANTDAGFSIVKYVGNVTAGATVGHGLSAAPKMIILKNMVRAGYGWLVYHSSVSPDAALGALNNTDAAITGIGYFNDTATTSTVFTLGNDTFGNYNGDNYIAYCWSEIAGYSKFGSYSGSGSDGNAVSLGFQPDYVMIHNATNHGNGWLIFDSARNTSNPRNNRLEANSSDAATTGSPTKNLDFNATDFEANGSDSEVNASGSTYAYMAFKINVS